MNLRKIRLLVLALSFGFLAVPCLQADTWAAPSTATYESNNRNYGRHGNNAVRDAPEAHRCPGP
jgi:hypothetical protein